MVSFVSMNAHAQILPSTSPDPRQNAKEVKEHDPSLGPQMGLDVVIRQKRYARNQFLRGVFGGLYLKEAFQRFFTLHYKKVLRRHPEWFDVLKIHEARYAPMVENSPSLVNANFEFEGISQRDYGYCWGFATLVRNFNVLAFYDPELKPTDEDGKVIDPQTDRNTWVEYYEHKIDQVAAYDEAVLFPGFKNFRELSMVPELELYLKLKTMQIWRHLAVGAEGFGIMIRTHRDMTPGQGRKLIDNLEARIARHEMPKLNIASGVKTPKPFSYSKYLHVVLAYGIKRLEGGGAKIQIWDPNYYGETLVAAPKEIEIAADGIIYYRPWLETDVGQFKKHPEQLELTGRLAKIEISPENNYETVKHIRELRRFCSDDETSKYCEGAKIDE